MSFCIGIINQKGGSGKSSTAVAMAYWLTYKQKIETLLVDADAQKSSSKWIKSLNEKEALRYTVISDADSLIEQVGKSVSNYQFVIINALGVLLRLAVRSCCCLT